MGDGRISVSIRRAWDSETGMDQASAGTLSDALPAHQSRGVLARTLAECRPNLQQFAGELIGRIAASLPRRCGKLGLVRQPNPEAAAETWAEMTISVYSSVVIPSASEEWIEQ